MKLPAIWNPGTTHADKKAQQALGLEEKLANLRKAEGIPDTVEIPFRCSATGERAAHIFARAPDGEKFKLVRTVKLGAPKDTGGWFAGLRRSKAAPPAIRYDLAQFDMRGRACPYCGSNRIVVHCSECGEATCGAMTVEMMNGKDLHTCHPECGAQLTLVSADYINGGKARSAGVSEADKPKQIAKAKTPLLPDMRPKALPKPPRLLPGPKGN